MPIDKALNRAPALEVIVGGGGIPEPQMDIEVVIDDDGGATIEMGEDEAQSVDFYDNLVDVIDTDALAKISLDVAAMFEADKGSRSD
jgi:hypothetical protein